MISDSMDTELVKRLLFSALRITAGVYGGLCIYLYFRQSALVYYPTRDMLETPKDAGLPYDDVILRTSDGIRIHAWYVPAVTSRGAILMCHGNGGNISHRLATIRVLHDLGLDVLIFDYRGYGRSEGKPSEKGTYQDAQAAWDYLTVTRGTPGDRIVIHGRSLGGAVAAWLAVREKPAALILESTFTSVPDMGSMLYPYLPVRLLCRFRYPTLDYVKQAHCPILFAHSPDDEMIPYVHGIKLFAAAPEPKTFFDLIGDHNAGEEIILPPYREKLDDFLTKALMPRGKSQPSP